MIIALCLESPITQRGGVSVLVETLLVEFVRLGHQVILVSNDSPNSLQETETGRLIKKHIFWDGHPTITKARQLAEELVGAGVELAHFHMGIYGWGNRFLGYCPIPYLNHRGVLCVTTAHMPVAIMHSYCDPEKPLWFKLLMFPLAWLGKMHQIFHVRAEIAVSKQGLRKLRHWYLPLGDRFRCIYQSRLYDAPIPPPDHPRAPIILNVGHVAWRKGQGVLTEAFAKIARNHPGWQLQLAGYDADGSTVRYIRQIIKEHRLEGRIMILGERHDAQDLMQRASIYVQPAFFEGLPLALQEAMFNGCPAIGTYADGISELIDDNQTGLLVPTGDAGKLAAALETLLQDAEKRRSMGAAAAIAIRQKGMTATSMVKNHLALYAELARLQYRE
jgi:glycosyltransferase involved in cell wall biosynthesis